MAKTFAPVEMYRGYAIWHGHPHKAAAEWCATGPDGTIWFEAADYEAVRTAIDQALEGA